MIEEQDRNGIIITYEVMHGYAGNFTQLNSSRNELLLSNLDKVQEYSIRVRGYTSVGGGPYSEVVTETTQEDSKWFRYRGYLIAGINCQFPVGAILSGKKKPQMT